MKRTYKEMLREEFDELVDIKKFQWLKETVGFWLNEGIPSRIEDKHKVYSELNLVFPELLALKRELFDKHSEKGAVCGILIEIDELIDALSERTQEMYREYNNDRLPLEIKNDSNEEE